MVEVPAPRGRQLDAKRQAQQHHVVRKGHRIVEPVEEEYGLGRPQRHSQCGLETWLQVAAVPMTCG